MELFTNAKTVRLRTHNSKYLHADEDEESVTQKRSDSSKTAEWTVELVDNVPENNIIRFKSCFGKYLTASNQRFLLGLTGHKVLQTRPTRLDSSIEWEPVREGNQVKLKTPYGQFLRANGGPPPWRNSVTHDIPYGSSTKNWILWDVDVIDIVLHSPAGEPLPQSDTFTSSESNSPSTDMPAGEPLPQSDTFSSSESNSPSTDMPAREPLPQSDTFSSSESNSPSTDMPAREPLPQSDTFSSSESNSPSTHTPAGEPLPQSDTFTSSELNSPSTHTPAGEPLPQSDTFNSSELNSPSTHTTPEAFQVSRQQSLPSKQSRCHLLRQLTIMFLNENRRTSISIDFL